MMKRLTVLSTLAVLIFVFTSATERVQKSAGPPSCNAGEPPNNTNCTSCHNDGVANTGTAQLTLDLGGADVSYVPGKNYTITVTVSRPGMRRAGFQCIALQDNNDKISPGKVTLTDETRTQLLDKNAPHSGGCFDEERVWIEHTYAGNSSDESGVSRWVYQWQAPTEGVGAITFYLAAVEANNDLAETGDQVYTLRKTITGLPVGIHERELLGAFIVYPLPAKDELVIRGNKVTPEEIVLYNTTGKPVRSWLKNEWKADEAGIKLSVTELPAGIYFIHIKGSFGEVTKKVCIQ